MKKEILNFIAIVVFIDLFIVFCVFLGILTGEIKEPLPYFWNIQVKSIYNLLEFIL